MVENQIDVANLFLSNVSPGSLTEYLLYGKFLANPKSFKFTFEYTENDEPYLYHINLLKILVISIKGREAVNLNLNKVQSIFKMKIILGMIKDVELKKEQEKEIKEKMKILELKNELIHFLNEVYLAPSRINIDKLFKYSQEFSDIFEQECRNLVDIFEQEFSKDRLEFNYIFSILIPFMINYQNKLLSNESILENIQRISRKSLDSLIDLIFSEFKNHQHRFPNNGISELKELLSCFKRNDKLILLSEMTEKKIILEEEEKAKTPEKKADSLRILWDNTLNSFLNSKILKEVKTFLKKMIQLIN